MGMKLPSGVCRACLKPLPKGRARYHPECRPPHKYRAKAVGDFASKKEHKRHSELLLLESQAIIEGLERQKVFPLSINGVKICTYIADFVYREKGVLVVEDAKGYRTPVFRLKAKIFRATMGFSIREV
jgi:hypothetical protein